MNNKLFTFKAKIYRENTKMLPAVSFCMQVWITLHRSEPLEERQSSNCP